ncbi:MAG: histidine kinase dimerization/phospho-acceptor domain-containing protein [Cyanobacteria bacterium J06559_3]
MTLPPLSQFVDPVPTCRVSETPARWLEACTTAGTDCLVLINAEAIPVRVVPLSQLLTYRQGQTVHQSSAHAADWAGPSVPIGSPISSSRLAEADAIAPSVVATTMPTEAAVQLVAANPIAYWIVVDPQQRHLGMLAKTKLLAAALTQLSSEPEPVETDAIAPTPPLVEPPDLETHIMSQQELSQSNTALLTYLGHELKTPLTSLLGLSSLLKTGRIGELNARQDRYVSLIQQHSRRLAAWVNTLIDLGRIESGTLRLLPSLVNLSMLWQEAYRQAALRVGQEDNESPPLPSLLRPDAPPIALIADPSRLQQMLICLMQTALAQQLTAAPETRAPLLDLEVWEEWTAFVAQTLEEDLYHDQLSQTTFSLPFPTTSAASTPLAGEMGHWLEWLLVRKLAQLHGGELVLAAHSQQDICPILLLPKLPESSSTSNSRFLLLVAPIRRQSIDPVPTQATQLNYRLLLTPQIKDAVEIASHLPLTAILVLVQGHSSVRELAYLKAQVTSPKPSIVALVPAQWSFLMGDLPADRELIWPAGSLGSVLLQPPSKAPAPNRLTILYLKTSDQETEQRPTHSRGLRLPHIFQEFGCRVLEVDTLEQAELLQRVWRPNVAVLDPAIANPTDYLQNLSQSPELVSLPLITLTMATTQAAHAATALTVFPCLVGETAWDTPETRNRMTAWLIQVLQAAATHSN